MFDQLIHYGPRHQSLESPAHQHIGLQTPSLVLIDKTQRILGAGFDDIADIGPERDDLTCPRT